MWMWYALENAPSMFHLCRVKQLLEVLQSCNDPLAFLLGLTANGCLHVLLMPLVDRCFTARQESLSENDVGAVVLDEQPHDPET